MLDKGRISSVQLVLLLFMMTSVTSFLYVSSIVAKSAGPDSWLSVTIVGPVFGLAVALVAITLAQRFPSQVITEYLSAVIGPIPGKAVAFAYSLFFLYLGALVLGEGVSFVHTAYLAQTPPWMLFLVFSVVAVYGAYLGIEAIARLNGMGATVFILSTLLMVALVVKDVDFSHLRPVLENGALPVIRGGMGPASWLGEAAVVLMLFPYLNQKREAMKSVVGAVSMTTVLKIIVVIATIGVFGSTVVSHLLFTTNTLAAYISVGNFLDRLELLIILIWVGGVSIKLTVLYHTASVGLASTLGLKNYRFTLAPVALCVILANLLFLKTDLQIVNNLTNVWP